MKDKEYDALYDGLVRGQPCAANKVLQFVEDLLTVILQDGSAGKHEVNVDQAANLLFLLNQEIKIESLWFESAAD